MTDPAAPLPYATPIGGGYDPDAEHLRLLAIFHFIVGPLFLLVGCFPVVYMVIGVLMIAGRFDPDPATKWVGAMFLAIGGGLVLAIWSLGGLVIYSGLQLRQRRRRTLSLIVAGIICLFFPFGTALGVFTLIVLCRRSVEDSYRQMAR